MFADDTKLDAPNSTEEDGKLLQLDIEHLKEWSCKWQIQFNASKCKVMHLGKTTPDTPT